MLTKLSTVLLDAKKACAAAIIGAAAAVSAGLIDDAVAAYITGIAAVVSTVVVYALSNIPKPTSTSTPTS